jgi:hypothetical protein
VRQEGSPVILGRRKRKASRYSFRYSQRMRNLRPEGLELSTFGFVGLGSEF